MCFASGGSNRKRSRITLKEGRRRKEEGRRKKARSCYCLKTYKSADICSSLLLLPVNGYGLSVAIVLC